MTLNFEPTVVDRWPTLREFMAHRLAVGKKPAKVVAADMDLSPSALSRKLNPADGDTQRLNVDDLERLLESTGDAAAVIEYLAAKFLDTPEARKQRLIARVESMLPDLAATLAALKGAA